MDADLEAMRSISRYRGCVECLLEPLLSQRRLAPMPCKHFRSVAARNEARRRYYEEAGIDDPGDEEAEEMQYCDCIPFNRRAGLWEIGDLCVKYTLTRTQMRELAAVLLLITRDSFTYNHVRRSMHDLFSGAHKSFLKAYARKRDDGASFADTMEALIPRWQFRMMPNA